MTDAQIGRGLAEVGARGPANCCQNVLELIVAGRGIEPRRGDLERLGHAGEGVGGRRHVLADAVDAVGLRVGEARPGAARSPLRSFTLCCRFLSAVLSKAWPIRWVTSPTSPAMRLAWAVSCADVGKRGAGPRLAAGAGRTRSARSRRLGSIGSGSYGMMLALHSPKRLAEAEIDRGLARQLDVLVDAEIGLHPLVLDEPDRLDPADLDAREA